MTAAVVDMRSNAAPFRVFTIQLCYYNVNYNNYVCVVCCWARRLYHLTMHDFGIRQLNLTAATFRFILHDQRRWNNARFVVCDIIIHVRVSHTYICFAWTLEA